MTDKPWYEDLASEEDKFYVEAVNRIKDAVLKEGMALDAAAALVDVHEAKLKEDIVEDSIKVLLAEMHFGEGRPLKDVSKRLGVALDRLERSRREMMIEVESAAIESFKSETGKGGNA